MNDLIARMHMDFRYMALNDLSTELHKSNTVYEDSVASRLIDAVLKTLEDKNGEVQNLGVKCLGPLVRRSRESHVQAVVDKLCQSGLTDELKDISSTALRTVILEVPPNSRIAASITKRLVPKLLLQMQPDTGKSDTLLDALDVLVELLSRFGRAISSLTTEELTKLMRCLTDLLDNSRAAVRKRTVVALASLAMHVPLETFSQMMNEIIQMLSIAKVNEKLKTLISLTGQICKAETSKSNQGRFEGYIQTIAPAVIDSLELDDDELREISLQSLESFVLQGGPQIKRYESQILQIIMTFLRYDPNYDSGSGNDEDMAEVEDDESDFGSEFDEDGEYDDDEDISWKVRRCSAKLATALLAQQPELLSSSCSQLCPALLARFNEREENVRTEVLTAFSTICSQVNELSSRQLSPSRKRSREEDEMDVESSSSPYTVINSSIPRVVKTAVKLLDGKSIPTKQAVYSVLIQLASLQNSGFDQYVETLIPPTRTVLTGTTSTGASPNSNLKIIALEFIDAIVKRSSGPQLDALAPLVMQPLLSDKLSRISSVAVNTAESLLRATSATKRIASYTSICKGIYERAGATDLDHEVRDQLLRTVGECVNLAPPNIDAVYITVACDILAAKLKNEATRMVTIITIGHVASVLAKFDPGWLKFFILESLKYTTNSNKSLRSAAIITSTALMHASNENLEISDLKLIVASINSLLETGDTQTTLSVLQWLSTSVQSLHSDKQKVMCEMSLPTVAKCLGGNTVITGNSIANPLTSYIEVVSKSLGVDTVLQAMGTIDLDNANMALIAKLIAASILAGPANHQLEQFLKTAKAPKTPENERALAIYILGDCGAGTATNEDMADVILAQFGSPSDRVKGAAAAAFGSIVAYDLDKYLSILLQRLDQHKEDGYLLALSIKEIVLQCSEDSRRETLAANAEEVWKRLFSLAAEDRAKSVVAECIGRLTLVSPHQLLPELQNEIKSSSTASRAVVVRAIRYTFTSADTGFDDQLRPFVVDFLSLMEDEDLEVRRLALSTLYSAAHNKPHLIQDHLARLLPLLYQETVIRQDLIHTVQMGPFKHIVDDGLELRKSAFETLHTLLESFYTDMDLNEVFDIILRGLDDVHEIKTLCFLMLSFLAATEPEATTAKLDAAAEVLQKLMAQKLKESAVKQDKERDAELKRSTLRCLVSLAPCATDATPGFNAVFDEVRSTRPKEVEELSASSANGVVAQNGYVRMEM